MPINRDAFTFKMCTISIRKFIYLISGACLINIYVAKAQCYAVCHIPTQPNTHTHTQCIHYLHTIQYSMQVVAGYPQCMAMSRLPVCHKIVYIITFVPFIRCIYGNYVCMNTLRMCKYSYFVNMPFSNGMIKIRNYCVIRVEMRFKRGFTLYSTSIFLAVVVVL